MTPDLIARVTKQTTAKQITFTNNSYSQRQIEIIEQWIDLCTNSLKCVFRSQNRTQGLKQVNFGEVAFLFKLVTSPPPISIETQEKLIRLRFNVRGNILSVFLPAIFCLELVNRYLGKDSPLVVAQLNKEELAVIALISTLIISECRENGTWGIYLCSIEVAERNQLLMGEKITICEQQTGQLIYFILDAALTKRLSENARLKSPSPTAIRNLAKIKKLVRITVDAKVTSLTTLFSLQPGIRWNLGKDLSVGISLSGTQIGFSDLEINVKKIKE